MNALSNLRADLGEYLRLVWRSAHIVVLGTAACVLVMGALTWAVPRLYLVKAQLDAGPIAALEPQELILFREALERGQFAPVGFLFPETLHKALKVTLQPPSTIKLQALTDNPGTALPRMVFLARAVETELNARLQKYEVARDEAAPRVRALQDEASMRVGRLQRVLRLRSAKATAASATAQAVLDRSSSRRRSIQIEASARVRRMLGQLHERLNGREWDTSSTSTSERNAVDILGKTLTAIGSDADATQPDNLFAALERDDNRWRAQDSLNSLAGLSNPDFSATFRELTKCDEEIAQALEAKYAADKTRQRDESGLPILNRHATFGDAAAAEVMQKDLQELEQLYIRDDATTAGAARETATTLKALADAHRALYKALNRGELTHASIVIPPSMPTEPAWPRPLPNLVIAFLFGIIGSILFVGFFASAKLMSRTQPGPSA